MAERFFYQFTQSLLPELVLLDGYVSLAADGYTSTSANLPLWMKSLTRNSAGNNTVVLTDNWDDLAFICVETVSYADAADLTICKITAFDAGSVATTSPYATTPASFTFQITSGGSAHEGPANGGLMFSLAVHNTKAL